MSPPQSVEKSAQPYKARSYLRVPIDLLVRYRSRPAVIGFYAGIARLNAIYKRAVDVSRTDFASWCGMEPDALAGCTKRAISDLEAGGWIIKETGEGGKLRLLAAWGKGADGKARPFRPDSRDRGKPSRARFVALPLDVFDFYLGRLIPDTHDQAKIERYFDRALLTFSDIGTYALRQLADVAATPRLTILGLVPTTPGEPLDMAELPMLADLLAHADSGTLFTCDSVGTPVAVALSPAGSAKRRQLAATPPASFVDQPRSLADRVGAASGSPSRSHAQDSQSAPACGETHLFDGSGAPWDEDGIMNQQHGDPSSKESQRAQVPMATMHVSPEHAAHGYEHPSEIHLIAHAPTPAADHTAAAREKYHISVLDAMIVAWHRAVNPGRAILDAELFALLDLQQRYGIAALRRWLFRTTNAGRTYVLPSYYEACAAAEAFSTISQVRGHQRPHTVDMPPDRVPPKPTETRPRAPQPAAPQTAPPRPLDAEHAGLIAEIEERAGCAIRRPEKLADVALDVLARWRDIAGHPGLLARWEMGWLVAEAAKGNLPPTLDELNRWAEDTGIHWSDPRLAPFGPARHDAAQSPAEDAPAEAASEDCGDGGAALLQAHAASAGLWQGVLEAMRSHMDRKVFHTWLRPTRLLTLTDSHAIISAPDAVSKGAIEGTYTHQIRALLRQRLGRTVDIRVVVASAAPYQPPPEWIDSTTWQQLDAGLRAALAGSALDREGGLDVRADVYDLLCACYAAPVRALLEHAQVRAS